MKLVVLAILTAFAAGLAVGHVNATHANRRYAAASYALWLAVESHPDHHAIFRAAKSNLDYADARR